MTSWIITATTTISNAHDHAERLVDELAGAAATTVDEHTITIDYPIDHPDHTITADTINAATGTLHQHLPGHHLTELHIRTEQAVDDELDQPQIPPLVGLTEAAQILGVTRQRAHAIAATPTFPPAIANLAAGPIYLESAVRAYANSRNRRPGRPVAL